MMSETGVAVNTNSNLSELLEPWPGLPPGACWWNAPGQVDLPAPCTDGALRSQGSLYSLSQTTCPLDSATRVDILYMCRLRLR